MALRDDILGVFQEVAAEQEKPLAPLSDDLGLLESGLDSLCWAIIVARLEDKYDCDPFAQVAEFPVTVGQFIALYENAMAAKEKDAAE